MLKSKIGRRENYGYIFILPFFLIFFIFQLYPMIYTISLSFTDLAGWAQVGELIGLKNYVTILSDQIFLKSIGTTFLIWGMNFIPQILLALLFAAWFTSIKKMRMSGFFKVVFYMPNIITAASMAVLFYSLCNHPIGPIDQILTAFGVPYSFNIFLSPIASQVTVSFIQFLMWYGSTMIVLVAAMLGISQDYYEAAMVDGASASTRFFRITLPLIKPIMLYTLVTSLIGGLQIFDIPYLLINGGPQNATQTMAVFIYKQAFTGTNNYGVASAASVVLFMISMLISLVMFRVLRNKNAY